MSSLGSHVSRASQDCIVTIGMFLLKLCLLLKIPGIIDSPTQSLFTYEEGKSWKDYYDPDFTPLFSPVFNDSALEISANATCKGDLFCLFDIAATKDVQIGMSTFQGSADLEVMMELSTPSMFSD